MTVKNLKPLVSVIVPVYNASGYIDECIGSIANQTYSNIEIIIIDDASTDSSMLKCAVWAKKDRRIRIVNHISNIGSFKARIAGLDIMNGEYFMFVDSDDYIKTDFIKMFVDRALSTGSDIVASDAFIVFGDGVQKRVDHPTLKYSSTNILKSFMAGVGEKKWGWSVWAKLYKSSIYSSSREYFKHIDSNLNSGDDLLFFVIMIFFTKKISYIKKDYAGYFYRKREASITSIDSVSKAAKSLADITRTFMEIERFLDKKGVLAKYRNDIESSMEWHIRFNVERAGNIYETPLNLKIETLSTLNSRLQDECANIELKLRNILNSKAYRLGRAVSLPYTALRRLAQCAMRHNR